MLIKKKDTLRGNCVPETEKSECSGNDLAMRYQRMTEALRWSVEVRRVDIAAEVSILSSFKVSPCEEHVETAHMIFMYSGRSV